MCLVISVLGGCCGQTGGQAGFPKPPFDMPELKAPVFPDRTFNVADFGAVPDGKTKNTEPFAKAIDACFKAGGGKVLVPKGDWLTGAVHLKSNVNLHFEDGAKLIFSSVFEDYLPVVLTRYEGTELYNYSPLIYARDCVNIAITGKGELVGNGQAWWDWRDQKRKEMGVRFATEANQAAEDGQPLEERIYGTRVPFLRTSFIQPFNCRNVLIEGISVGSGPFWSIHPVYCENVIVRGISAINHGPNNDGVTPDSCKNVLIEDCYFDTGDDCITLKSGRNRDARRVGKPCENIVIRNCRTKQGHGGVVIGSEMSGGVRNVFVHDCVFNGTDNGIRMKTTRGRGGVVENIWVQDVKMGVIGRDAIKFNMRYGSTEPRLSSDMPGIFRNIYIKNVTCQKANQAVYMRGLPDVPIENIVLENVKINSTEGANLFDASNITFKNVHITSEKESVFRIENCRDILISNSSCPDNVNTFAHINGSRSQNIKLDGLRLTEGQKALLLEEDVSKDSVIVTDVKQ